MSRFNTTVVVFYFSLLTKCFVLPYCLIYAVFVFCEKPHMETKFPQGDELS